MKSRAGQIRHDHYQKPKAGQIRFDHNHGRMVLLKEEWLGKDAWEDERGYRPKWKCEDVLTGEEVWVFEGALSFGTFTDMEVLARAAKQ